jgi:2'-5' RNA ligase
MARLFFALWPDAPVRHALLHLIASAVPAEARATRPENLHLTLAFLGTVAAERLHEVQETASSLRAAACPLTLDRLEHWAAPGILCLTPAVAPQSLQDLVAGLRMALRARNLPVDERPYRPHVTLCRKLRSPAGQPLSAPVTGIDWRAQEFVLAESADDSGGSTYRIIARWPLTSSPAVS